LISYITIIDFLHGAFACKAPRFAPTMTAGTWDANRSGGSLIFKRTVIEMQAKATTLRRVIRKRDLSQFAGLQRTQINALIKQGEFPAPIKLSDSGRAVGWFEDELIQWQQERLAARDTKRRSR
jgi:predicted DNA-binding transcriptional regulator AlpA